MTVEPRGLRSAAAVAFAAALALWGWTAVRAFSARPVVAGAPADMAARGSSQRSPVPTGSAEDIRLAAANDPFSADRGAAPERVAAPQSEVAASPAAPPVRLVGTVLLPGGHGFAVCQLGDASPRVVHVGEKLGTLTLASVSAGRATFASAGGGTTVVTVPKPGS